MWSTQLDRRVGYELLGAVYAARRYPGVVSGDKTGGAESDFVLCKLFVVCLGARY